MKSSTLKIFAISILSAAAVSAAAIARPADSGPMTKSADGTYIVDTSAICDAKGYKGATPLLVYIKDDKVVNVEPLANNETPSYFRRLKKDFMQLWNGHTVAEAADLDVNCRTGATYSAKAVKQNIDAALEYYKAHK